MIRNMLATAILIVVVTALASAQDRGFGLGLILGEPTGLSAKAWVSSNNALDFGAAWSFRHKGFFHLHGDYLWHWRHAIQSSEEFVPYAGIGARVAAGRGEGIFGVRFVGGLAWWPHGAPIDVFVEVAPILDLVETTALSGNGGVGVRFYFK